jgi:hypothetical protein
MNQVAAAHALASVPEGVTTPKHQERPMKTLKAEGRFWFANVEGCDERLPLGPSGLQKKNGGPV